MSLTKKDHLSSYSRRLRENIKSVLENYSKILEISKISEDDQQQKITEAQVALVENEIEIRAANIVRAAEALTKLVSDLKENLILNDFSTINEVTSRRIADLGNLQKQQEERLKTLYASFGNTTGGGVESQTRTEQS